MIHSLHLDSFYFTTEQLDNTPSRQDGIDKDTEASLRMYGCELIQEAGILLSYHQVVMATGQVLLHRFYCKRSMKSFNVKKVAATALWLAAKLEEVKEVCDHPRKLLERVMVAVDRCIARRETPEGRKVPVLDSHSKEGEEFRRSLIRYEAEMLRAFGFIMNVEHPHRLLCNYCQLMFTPYLNDENEKWQFLQRFVQEAWNVANDSLRTMLCVRFKGSVVACGIIFFTARRLKVPLPDSWWELFLVKLEDMCEVCRVLHELYMAPKPSFIPVCHQLLPSKPPIPAGAPGAAAIKVAITATPTPMLGATPELSSRPGGKPLDPSVQRTMAASESTQNLAAAAGTTANADKDSTLPSPETGTAPSSARKRSRSPSPSLTVSGSHKRHQLDNNSTDQHHSPSAALVDQQLLQQAQVALAASDSVVEAGERPRSAGAGVKDLRPPSERESSRSREKGRDRDRQRDSSRDRERERGKERDRDRDRASWRDRPRSHSRDHRRRTSRERSRRSRSRERRRSRSRDRRRSRSRDRRRDRDYRDSRDRSRDRGGRDAAAGKELKSPAKADQQPNAAQGSTRFPAPPQEPVSPSNHAKQPSMVAAHEAEPPLKAQVVPSRQAPHGNPAAHGEGSKENQQGSSKAHGRADSDQHDAKQDKEPSQAAAGQDQRSPAADTSHDQLTLLPAGQPKPKPKAIRKQQSTTGPAGGPPEPGVHPAAAPAAEGDAAG